MTKASRASEAAARAARPSVAATPRSRAPVASHVADVVSLGRAAGNEAVAAYLQREPAPLLAVQRDGPRRDRIRSVRRLGAAPGAGGAQNQGMFAVTGAQGEYVVKLVATTSGLHRASFADRVMRQFGVKNTGGRALSGPRAYGMIDQMLAAAAVDGEVRTALEATRKVPDLRLLVMHSSGGASWLAGSRPTLETQDQLAKPEVMQELGKIFAIDALLGNADRIRHVQPLGPSTPGESNPLTVGKHQDNLMTTPQGLVPVDQDTVLPGPTTRAFHLEGDEEDPAAESLAESPELYSARATDSPMYQYEGSGGQKTLRPRFGAMKLSSLVNDAYLDLVSTEILKDVPGVDKGPLRDAFRVGVNDVVGRMGDRATRRELTRALDEVHREADPHERTLLDKAALRMRMKFLSGLHAERAGLQGRTGDSMTALGGAATRHIETSARPIGTERWIHGVTPDKVARWAPAVLEVSTRRLTKARDLMEGRLAGLDRPPNDRRVSMRRHVLALMNRTYRALSSPGVSFAQRGQLETALRNFGQANALLKRPVDPRLYPGLALAPPRQATNRTGAQDVVPEFESDASHQAREQGKKWGRFKKGMAGLGLLAAAGLGLAAAFSGKLPDVLTGSIGSIPGIGNAGPAWAWIGGGAAALGLGGFLLGRRRQQQAAATEAREAQGRAAAGEQLAGDANSPRSVPLDANVHLYDHAMATRAPTDREGPITLVPETRVPWTDNPPAAGETYIRCYVVYTSEASKAALRAQRGLPPKAEKVTKRLSRLKSGKPEWVRPADHHLVALTDLQGFAPVSPENANPRVPADYQRPGDGGPTPAEDDVENPEAMAHSERLHDPSAAGAPRELVIGAARDTPAPADIPGLVDVDLGSRSALAPVPERAKDEELDRTG